MNNNIELVNHLLTIWWAGDIEGASSMLTEDFLWENMPWPEPENAAHGRQKFAEVSRGWREICEGGHHVNTHEYAAGDTVIVERVETFTVRGLEMTLHVAGFFSLRGNKISGWRDYYDNEAYMRQMKEAGVDNLAAELTAEVTG